MYELFCAPPGGDILSRLSRVEAPLSPPPVHALKPPVPEVSPHIVENPGTLLHLLNADLNTLTEYAR